MSDVIYRRKAELMEAEIDDEIVALDRNKGKCFGFNSVATDVWRLLEQPQSETAIVDALRIKYEVDGATCAKDVGLLLGDLQKLDLVEAEKAVKG